ncbi:MAG: hypothetical protein ABIF77_09060 [bacterium]
MKVRQRSKAAGAEDATIVHYLNFARRQKRLTFAEEKKLLAGCRSGERSAIEALVNASQFLVVAVSETYEDVRLSFLDRIAEGNVALIQACRHYHLGLDGSFRGYCLLKIHKAIDYALAKAAGFRIIRWDDGWPHPAYSIDHDNSPKIATLEHFSRRGE